MEYPALSVRFYEDEIVKSYKCFVIDDDNIKICVYNDDVEVDSISLTEQNLRNVLNGIDDDIDEYFYTKSVPPFKIKKSFIKNLVCLLD